MILLARLLVQYETDNIIISRSKIKFRIQNDEFGSAAFVRGIQFDAFSCKEYLTLQPDNLSELQISAYYFPVSSGFPSQKSNPLTKSPNNSTSTHQIIPYPLPQVLTLPASSKSKSWPYQLAEDEIFLVFFYFLAFFLD